MGGQVEHANIRVRDIDETVKFLTTALPNFKVRGGVLPKSGSTSERNRLIWP